MVQTLSRPFRWLAKDRSHIIVEKLHHEAGYVPWLGWSLAAVWCGLYALIVQIWPYILIAGILKLFGVF